MAHWKWQVVRNQLKRVRPPNSVNFFSVSQTHALLHGTDLVHIYSSPPSKVEPQSLHKAMKNHFFKKRKIT
jgi:hypothetical protein